MFSCVRSLAWLIPMAWLTACDSRWNNDAINTQVGILPPTESFKDFGDYVVHVNVLNTDQLTANIARRYEIVRSENRALLNVTVRRKEASGQTVAVSSDVAASAINLTGHKNTVALREIKAGEAIYYLGELPVADGEVLIYTIDVTPSGESRQLTVRFKKQFFVQR